MTYLPGSSNYSIRPHTPHQNHVPIGENRTFSTIFSLLGVLFSFLNFPLSFALLSSVTILLLSTFIKGKSFYNPRQTGSHFLFPRRSLSGASYPVWRRTESKHQPSTRMTERRPPLPFSNLKHQAGSRVVY